jgi:hypothetical protein
LERALLRPKAKNDEEVRALRTAKARQRQLQMTLDGSGSTRRSPRRHPRQTVGVTAGPEGSGGYTTEYASDKGWSSSLSDGPSSRAARTGSQAEASDATAQDVFTLINPTIVSASETTDIGIEGCLSLPDELCLVRRSQALQVEYTLADGTRVREAWSGLPAVVFQHELDHLDGLLQMDREVQTFLKRSREEEYDAAYRKWMMGLLKYYGVQSPDEVRNEG